jgi:hypothetical protein
MDGKSVNHIALVDRGRAGREVRILDAEPAPQKRGDTMKITIGGLTFDVEDNVGKALEKEREEHRVSFDRIKGENEGLKNRKLSLDDAHVKELVDAEIARREAASKLEAVKAELTEAGLDVEGKSYDHIMGMYSVFENSAPNAAVKIDAGTKDKESVSRYDIEAARRNVYGG